MGWLVGQESFATGTEDVRNCPVLNVLPASH